MAPSQDEDDNRLEVSKRRNNNNWNYPGLSAIMYGISPGEEIDGEKFNSLCL
jgi:hypothetical protein